MSSLSTVVYTILSIQSSVKLMHWTTKSYATHQALGALYAAIEPRSDQLVESMMGLGLDQKINMSGALTNWSAKSKDIPQSLVDMHDKLVSFRKSIDASLQSILDEIVNEFRVAMFLCKMK